MIELSPLNRVPTQADLLVTHEAIHPFVHRTPVLTNRSIDALTGATLYFKCENFQRVGAFKMRGGASAALRFTPTERSRGLATHSSGNHAQAVACAARQLGVPAYIVMPHDAPRVKVAAVKGYGAEITYCNNTPTEREAALQEVVRRTGAAFIHPFDDYGVIAGQATAAMELIEDVPEVLDVILTPVGGGGLLAGTALAARYFSTRAKVYAGEPAGVDDAFRSLQSGRIETNPTNVTVADGLRTHLGQRTFPIIQQYVTEVCVVRDEEIVAAMRLIWERMKIIVEPSCSVPLAAVRKYSETFAGCRIGIILTGGNVDVDRLPFG